MADRNSLIEARLPRGFEDRAPADIAAVDRMIATIKTVYERYGFDPVETPLLEYTETLGKFLPDTDRPNAGVFSLQDDDEQWMSLRYDLTAPLARYFAQNYDRLPKPFRSYRAGYVFRNEKPGPGRFRQFMQFDADTVGAAGPEADAEMCMMMADTMDALGLGGRYVVKANNRKVLDGVLASADVADEGQKLAVLRAIDKLDKFGADGVELLLGEGRKDESGDFTKGAGLNANQRGIVLDYIAGNPPDDNPGVQELGAMRGMFDAAGYGPDRIRIEPSVVRGLEYYTGPVFEIELTFQVPNEKGQPVVFGSVGGGGRYDGLVSRFRSEPVPATGFSIGVSRLANALKMTGLLSAEAPTGPVVILVLDRDADAVADYQRMTSELRQAGIRAEMYLGSSGMNAQMKYADRRNAAAAVIVGSNERAEGKVTIKDLAAGAEAAKAIKDNAEYKAAKVGQSVVARADLVAELSKIPSIARMRSGA
ncbi:MAG: histidine--tRNA ligase [Devosia sp.]|uniref:histidine--tRNA ligase n=1 Tax=Devosia sp. 66-22 TaxID=1895753 RepID=UPI0009291939|nr:histidine--tRNA ligase [Devosia sp. 66-22]MBN9345800.1 histidine--tRNA ligase [Devosia sp.]OJX51237.1 MAG: histidine--tRNA ligase [Devosia sp. 66-22]